MLSPLAWLYIIFNFASALGIVFANKAVFAIFSFPYPIGLTWIHSIFTMAGMQLMRMVSVIPRQPLTREINSLEKDNVLYVIHLVFCVAGRIFHCSGRRGCIASC